jgi:hypothetical protein
MKTTSHACCVAACILLLQGCAASHLVFVQETSFGLSVELGADVNKMSLGYDRDVFAIVPEAGDTAKKDAMSVFAINEATVGGISDMKISEFIATGSSAEKLVKNSQLVEALRNKIYGSTTDNSQGDRR